MSISWIDALGVEYFIWFHLLLAFVCLVFAIVVRFSSMRVPAEGVVVLDLEKEEDRWGSSTTEQDEAVVDEALRQKLADGVDHGGGLFDVFPSYKDCPKQGRTRTCPQQSCRRRDGGSFPRGTKQEASSVLSATVPVATEDHGAGVDVLPRSPKAPAEICLPKHVGDSDSSRSTSSTSTHEDSGRKHDNSSSHDDSLIPRRPSSWHQNLIPRRPSSWHQNLIPRRPSSWQRGKIPNTPTPPPPFFNHRGEPIPRWDDGTSARSSGAPLCRGLPLLSTGAAAVGSSTTVVDGEHVPSPAGQDVDPCPAAGEREGAVVVSSVPAAEGVVVSMLHDVTSDDRLLHDVTADDDREYGRLLHDVTADDDREYGRLLHDVTSDVDAGVLPS